MANPWHDIPIGDDAPDEFHVVIEVPKGSKVKYELDEETGFLEVDRVLHGSFVYPANYGFLPQTLADDDDPLDAIVLMQEPVQSLSTLEVRPIGMLHMLDEGERDENIICVLVEDPIYNVYTHINEFPDHLWSEIKQFFSHYKDLEGKEVEVGDVVGPEEAKEYIQHAMELYKQNVAAAS
jgi:inorganic pyrophosphatase